ncbi:MAG: hypothetical protein ACRELY_19840 [Polyangiaceae bacterium]
MRRRFACMLLAAANALVISESSAFANPPEAPVKPTENGAERRSGIVFGLSLGVFGLGGASGTPNNANKINDSRYYSSSGLMLGNSFTLFIMGALADPISFGFFFNGQSFSNGDYKASGSGFGFRLDLYPFAISKQFKPILRDIAVTSEFGIGGVLMTPKNDDKTISAQGTQSFLSTGIMYDMKVAKLLGGHLSLGPEVDYQVVTSTSAEEHGVSVAFRLAFNGGP